MMKFRIRSIDFSVDFIVIALYSIVILVDTSHKILSCFLAAVLHEIGHLTAMCIIGEAPAKIRVKLFDVRIVRNNNIISDLKELFITYSGVTVNFIFAAATYYFNIFFCKNFTSGFVYYFMIANLALGLFNSLPVLTLDGGQGLVIILSRFISENAAVRIINILTFVLIFPISVIGFIVLFKSKYNYSLLIISIYLIMVLVLKNSSWSMHCEI